MRPERDRHSSRAGATLGAAVVRDGQLDRVDAWTPLDELMSAEGAEPGTGEEVITMTREEFAEKIAEARLAGIMAFLRYTWFGATNLWEAMKRLLAITRKTKPDFIRGMSVTQVAWMLQETKAATSAREIRIVEGYLQQWGVLGFQGAGGSKSIEARRKYAAVQQGNTNRADAVARAAAERDKGEAA